jgi:hypothetical protein
VHFSFVLLCSGLVPLLPNPAAAAAAAVEMIRCLRNNFEAKHEQLAEDIKNEENNVVMWKNFVFN